MHLCHQGINKSLLAQAHILQHPQTPVLTTYGWHYLSLAALDRRIVRAGRNLWRSPSPIPLPRLGYPRAAYTGTHPGGYRHGEHSAAKLPRQHYAPRTLP